MMTSREIRQSFLDFFRERGHTIVPSAPVVPHGDPTLLFTNAGMNQFKDVFLGMGTRDYTRAADTQKCIRASGKHNDLEDVGHDTYHHTFFEMLGNWSFGDYYKGQAIAWAWELLTQVWGLDPKRLYATVYRSDDGSETDDEAVEAWLAAGIDREHILFFGAKDNFWEMGETGPCGPCSEIHYDRTPDFSGRELVNAGVPEVIEIWNNVFIQYNRRADRSLEPLPAKHVDTGMGFERICAVLQGKSSNYDTDVFAPLLDTIGAVAGRSYGASMEDRGDIAMRVIADHIRTLTFAIADGAAPGNTGRGYVLRRILRRAVKYAWIDLGVKEPLLYRLVGTLVETMGEVFPEIRVQRDYIEKIVRAEEEQFGGTLDMGIKQFLLRADDAVRKHPSAFNSIDIWRERVAQDVAQGHSWPDEMIKIMLPASDAFLLYDTFGFPLDLTQLLARENYIHVDVAGFDALMTQQKERARAARKNSAQEATDLQFETETEFIGCDQTAAEATVAATSEVGLVLDRTPFYAEMGGQVADTGTLTVAGESYPVSDVRKIGSAFLHIIDGDAPEVAQGARVEAKIDTERRDAIERNHSATHILHEALRRVLGTHVQQAGSLVAPEHLRFDFNHFERVAPEQLREIEAMVNAKVREAIDVVTEELSIEDARALPNVKMFFGDKYGSRVRVVTIDPEFSREFCGGTHVRNTADIGYVKLVSEASIQAGVRRLEAVTGTTADELLLGRYEEIERIARRLNVPDREVYNRIEALLEERKALERELASVRRTQAAGALDALIAAAQPIEGGRLVVGRVEVVDNEALRDLGEELRSRLGTGGVGLLGAEIEGKASLVCAVTDDLVGRYQAGKLVGAVAKLVGGGGGGKPHLATAGGRDAAKLDEALAGVPAIVAG